MLLCGVTMSLIQQEKNENVFFSWTAYMFPFENEYNLIVWVLVLLKNFVAEMYVHWARMYFKIITSGSISLLVACPRGYH